MNGEMIGGFVRTVLATVGGYFVAKGKLSATDLNTIIGAVIPLAVLGWSLWVKRKA